MKNLFAKDELKFLGAFYLERFISHLIYFAPAFWIIFFNETLSLVQISVLFSALAISTFIFDIFKFILFVLYLMLLSVKVQ